MAEVKKDEKNLIDPIIDQGKNIISKEKQTSIGVKENSQEISSLEKPLKTISKVNEVALERKEKLTGEEQPDLNDLKISGLEDIEDNGKIKKLLDIAKNKSIISILILIFVGLGIVGFYFSKQQSTSQNPINTTSQNIIPIPIDKGRMIFGIMDTAVPVANISSVFITINNLQIYNNEKGWVTISNEEKTYDLLSLKQNKVVSLIAKIDIEPGNYSKIKLLINKVMVVENGVSKEAKLPSEDFKIFSNIPVNIKEQSTVVFDFITNKSLHITDNGEFVFIPVVKIKIRNNNNDQINLNNEININKDQGEAMISLGMDINGEVRKNFMLDENAKINIVKNVIKLTLQGENNKLINITAIIAIDKITNNKYLDKIISIKLVTKNGKMAWLVSGLKNLELNNIYINTETGFIINIVSAENESCLNDINVAINETNQCGSGSDCIGIPVICAVESINSIAHFEFNNTIKEIQSRCLTVFDKICALPKPNYFNYQCTNNKCVSVLKPIYETKIDNIKFILESSEDMGNILKSQSSYEKDLTTTERFIKVVIGAQNKGVGSIPQYSWDVGDIVDSDGRRFVNINNKAYSWLPRPDLCGALLKPEFDPIPCVKYYEISKASTKLKVIIKVTPPKQEESFIDLNLNQ